MYEREKEREREWTERRASRQACCRYSSVEEQTSVSSRSDRAIHSLSPREEREGEKEEEERRKRERMEERSVCVGKKRDGEGGGALMHCFS